MSRRGVGSFFAWAGAALTLLGAAFFLGRPYLSGEASLGVGITGSVFGMIGLIWLVVGLGLRALVPQGGRTPPGRG